MQMKWVVAVAIAAALGALNSAAESQTNVSGSFYRTFTTSTTGNGTVQVPTDSYGGLIELRHIQSPFIGYGVSYGYNRDNQSLSPEAGSCGYFCNNTPAVITSSDSNVSLNWIVSGKFGGLRPFAEAGVGFWIAYPSGPQNDLNTIVRPVYSFGGGADWAMTEKFGLRFQFRDNLFKAPDVWELYLPTGAYTQVAEPMAGVYYKF